MKSGGMGWHLNINSQVLKKGFWVLIAAALLFAGFKLVLRTRSADEARLSEPIRRGAIIESVYGIGTVKANRSFQFKPGIVTTITDIHVKEGDSVRAGQKLLDFGGDIPFTAPFDGTVTSLPVKVGENVFSQTVALEVTDLQDRYVTVSLEQRAAVRVRRGQPARLSFENLRETSYSGVVESVYSSGSDFLVRIEAGDLPPQILPGMTADVAIGVNEHADAILVPASAITEGFVQVRREGKKTFSTPVRTGIVDGASAEVISGDLKPGDRVLLPADRKP